MTLSAAIRTAGQIRYLLNDVPGEFDPPYFAGLIGNLEQLRVQIPSINSNRDAIVAAKLRRIRESICRLFEIPLEITSDGDQHLRILANPEIPDSLLGELDWCIDGAPQHDRDIPQVQDARHAPCKTKKPPVADPDEFRTMLIAALDEHHQRDGNHLGNTKPVTFAKLGKDLNVSPSTVGRHFAQLAKVPQGKASRTYLRLLQSDRGRGTELARLLEQASGERDATWDKGEELSGIIPDATGDHTAKVALKEQLEKYIAT